MDLWTDLPMDSTSLVGRPPSTVWDKPPRPMKSKPLSVAMTAPRLLSIAACVALTLSQSASANTTYRWVDQNGNPVLSDRPPEAGIPYTEVGVDSGFKRYPKPTHVNEPDVNESGQAGASSTDLSPASATSAPARIEVVSPQPDLCDQAQDNIFKLETFPRMRVQDENGEVRFMTDGERSAQLAAAYRVRDANCDFD